MLTRGLLVTYVKKEDCRKEYLGRQSLLSVTPNCAPAPSECIRLLTHPAKTVLLACYSHCTATLLVSRSHRITVIYITPPRRSVGVSINL